MIDERSLLAAIKDAWRTGGYSVVGNGGELVLQGSGWLAVLPRGIVPRKVLALLVVAPRRDDIEDALRQRLEQLPLA